VLGIFRKNNAADLLPPDATRQRNEKIFATWPITLFKVVAISVFLFLLTGFWELQVRNHWYFKERAEANRIKSVPIMAPRGKILDRDGRVIVDNDSSFSLSVSRELLKPEHIQPIATGLNMDPTEFSSRLKRFKAPKYKPLTVKQELTEADRAFVEGHKDEYSFPELDVVPDHRRFYPNNGLLAHVLGYVGEVSETELNGEMAKYNQGDVVGKSGVERYYNEHLAGSDGQRRVIVDSAGTFQAETEKMDAVSGKNLILTIDLDLQATAEMLLEGKVGAIVAMDPRSGEILAMASRPTYDPNKFTRGIKSEDWRNIMDNPDKPLLNRAVQAQLAPGSTFKPITAIAGMESGLITPGFRVNCSGGHKFYDRYFKCHARGGHGSVDLRRAISQSCDVFFYTVGNMLGIDKIAEYGSMAGLGKRTGIDLPAETEGTMPSSKWKIRTHRQKWFLGETISVSIGQGYVAVSPLQLAHAMSGLVNGGVWHRPHLAKIGADPRATRRYKLEQEHINRIMEGLYGVVNADGTAPQVRLASVAISGKTGTAQRVGNDKLNGRKASGKLADDAWFFGFAPRNNPEIMVAALYENGLHGYSAGLLVRDVIRTYFEKRARRQLYDNLKNNSPAERVARLMLPGAGVSPAASRAPQEGN
jgi:penicillin-binding protein 2